MTFAATINRATKTAIQRSGEAVVYLPGTGGAIATYAVPRAEGVKPREGSGGRVGGYVLALELPKLDVPVVVKNEDRIRFPGSWIRPKPVAGEVTWLVSELELDEAAEGSWVCVMRAR